MCDEPERSAEFGEEKTRRASLILPLNSADFLGFVNGGLQLLHPSVRGLGAVASYILVFYTLGGSTLWNR